MVSNVEIQQLRTECNKIMKQMFHCKQCRADAIGTLDNDMSVDLAGFLDKGTDKKMGKKLRFAIASKSGINVDLHFGHAEEFYIYDYLDGKTRFIEKRNVQKYCSGNNVCEDDTNKITKLIKTMEDCNAVIAMRIGDSPKIRIKDKGIVTISTYNTIEKAILEAVNQF
jgi:predicted Fe-Mo cluster-binding NifX family protein